MPPTSWTYAPNSMDLCPQLHESPHGIIPPWGDKRGAHFQFARSALLCNLSGITGNKETYRHAVIYQIYQMHNSPHGLSHLKGGVPLSPGGARGGKNNETTHVVGGGLLPAWLILMNNE